MNWTTMEMQAGMHLADVKRLIAALCQGARGKLLRLQETL